MVSISFSNAARSSWRTRPPFRSFRSAQIVAENKDELPQFSTRLACFAHPIGAAVIAIFGGGAASAFTLLHGAGNGILTIARGTLPLAFGLLIEPLGRGIVVVSADLSLAALVALQLLRAPSPARDVSAAVRTR